MVDLNARTVDGETDLTVTNLDVDDTAIFDGPVYFNSTVTLPGTISVTNISCTTLDVSSTTTLSSLTPSQSVQTNASSQLTTIANTGTGSNVLAVSPTLTTPNLGAAAATSLSLTTALSPSDGGTGQTSLASVTVGNATNAVNATNATTATSAATAGSATVASNLGAGTAGGVAVQTAPSTTGFVNPGTSGEVLTSNGAGVPPSFASIPATNLATGVTGTLAAGNGGTGQTSLSAVTVGNATAAVTSTNVAGGTTGSLVVQTGVGTSGFIAGGTAGQVLTANGAGVAPTYQSSAFTGVLPVANGGTGQTSLAAVQLGTAGTWTPSFSVGGTPQVGYASQEGAFIISGGNTSQTRIITVYLRIHTTNAITNPVGNLVITGWTGSYIPQFPVTGTVSSSGFGTWSSEGYTAQMETDGTIHLYRNGGNFGDEVSFTSFGSATRKLYGNFTYVV